jgi:PASTA domain
MVDGNEERRDRSGAPDAEREPGRPGPDETVRQPAPDQTAPAAGPGVPPQATAPLPLDAAGDRPDEPAAWSGRAAVPPASGAEVRETGPVAWPGTEERPDGRPWWLPILAGIVTLILVTVLAYGLWLIFQSREGEPPVTPTPPPPPATSAPTSAPPTTEQPSPTQPETTARTVVMPPVVGLPQEAATALLDQLGVGYRLRFRPSEASPGTVTRSEPDAGEPVAPGTQVTLTIAEARPQGETTAPAPATSTPDATPPD